MLITYKITFFNKEEKYREFSDLIQLLHNNGVNFYFAFNQEEFNGVVYVITQNEIDSILSLLENAIVEEELLNRVFSSLIFFKKNNYNAMNKSSIKNYILKNKDFLIKANDYSEFISIMKYNSPKNIHKYIFEEFKKSDNLEKIALNVQLKLKNEIKKNQFIHLTSNSNKNYFKVFFKKIDNFSKEFLTFDNNSYYGLVKVNNPTAKDDWASCRKDMNFSK